MTFYDAHNHLHDARLQTHSAAIDATVARLPLRAAVVNGTQESDWDAVSAFAQPRTWVRPSFGLHPWYVKDRSPRWLAHLTEKLDQVPGAVIGEIGLDRWIEGYDLAAQLEVFAPQMELAVARNLPAAIHCLKAWGALWDWVRAHRTAECGFLLHSYGGPTEMIDGFVQHGAYFSFSAYYLHERKAAQREAFRQIPSERLLVETDAPDMPPPAERNSHPLTDPATRQAVNDPANIELAYAGLAEVRGWRMEDLAEIVEDNFQRLYT
jgi:TatD DNase family protein